MANNDPDPATSSRHLISTDSLFVATGNERKRKKNKGEKKTEKNRNVTMVKDVEGRYTQEKVSSSIGNARYPL